VSPDKIVAYHRSMLLDEERTGAFARAIEATVQPGDAVLDIGTGTGVLALLALRAGARHVYAVEEGAVIEMAREMVRASGAEGRVTLLRAESFRVRLPEPVAVVVSETVGNFGVDEGILETLIDARARFLAPGGRVLPRALALHAAPVTAPALHRRTVSWAGPIQGLDFAPLRRFGANHPHRETLSPDQLLAGPVALGRIDLERVRAPAFRGAGTAVVRAEGICHGLGGWFSCELAPGQVLSSAPPTPAPSWNHAFLPLDPPLPVRAGERLDIEVTAAARGTCWTWRVARADGSGDRREHGTGRAPLAAPGRADAAPLPRHPRLNASGALVGRALALLDGGHTLAEIADDVAARHPDEFPERGCLIEYLERLVAKFGS